MLSRHDGSKLDPKKKGIFQRPLDSSGPWSVASARAAFPCHCILPTSLTSQALKDDSNPLYPCFVGVDSAVIGCIALTGPTAFPLRLPPSHPYRITRHRRLIAFHHHPHLCCHVCFPLCCVTPRNSYRFVRVSQLVSRHFVSPCCLTPRPSSALFRHP